MWASRGSYLEYERKKKGGKVGCRLVLRARTFYKGLNLFLDSEAFLLGLVSFSDKMHSLFLSRPDNTVITL